jgi:hypothetical protein
MNTQSHGRPLDANYWQQRWHANCIVICVTSGTGLMNRSWAPPNPVGPAGRGGDTRRCAG